MDASSKIPSPKWDNRVSDKKVCKYCNRKFSNGRALGGHIRTHNITKFSTNKTQKRDSSSPLHTTNSYYLSGWQVHKKRGSNQVKGSSPESKEAQSNNSINKQVEAIEKSQEKETDQDSTSDGDDKGFISMMERLREFESSDSNHKISRTRSRYVCLTCDMVFPTFHAVRCHVYQSLSSPANNIADRFAEEYENSDSSNQAVVVTSNPPRLLDFDLNELPPMEDEE